MNKSKLNFIIDIIMLVIMGALAGIGFLIRYILLPGADRWIKYGRNVDMSFYGLDRHQWGDIHLILAFVLIGFLVLHIIFHWDMIVCLYRKLVSNKDVRILCASAFTIITLILISFPLFIQVEIHEMASGKDRYNTLKHAAVHNEVKGTMKTDGITMNKHFHMNKSEWESFEEEHNHIDPSIEVKGFMSLWTVSKRYEVPCDLIKEKLKIPVTTSNSLRLAYLRKQYNFKMSEIEVIIYNYKNSMNHEKNN